MAAPPLPDDPDAWTDDQLVEHIQRGGAAPEGDDVGRLLEMIRDAGDGRPT